MIGESDIQIEITHSGKYFVSLFHSHTPDSVFTIGVCDTNQEAMFVKERWERWFVMWTKVEDNYNELSATMESSQAMDNAWWNHGQSHDSETCG